MEPSTFDRAKTGCLMGGTVGLCIGLVFGTVHLIRYGGGSRGAVHTLGQYMISSAATFGFFMGIGTVIRSEGAEPLQLKNSTQPRVVVAPRAVQPLILSDRIKARLEEKDL
ncbi:uncharacterized protein VTP21DRAFT_3877 [Calcarisporiella thermophila]|uniref:uncharacterized protein n=1 Tax=Calcarisporiella thermophila TaxID=911321 RepID=UPI003743DD0D